MTETPRSQVRRGGGGSGGGGSSGGSDSGGGKGEGGGGGGGEAINAGGQIKCIRQNAYSIRKT
jgi:hypothetical protein